MISRLLLVPALLLLISCAGTRHAAVPAARAPVFAGQAAPPRAQPLPLPMPPAPQVELPEFGQVMNIRDGRLTEASGLAGSLIQNGRLWAINDSGNAPALFALATNGATTEHHLVDGAKNRDWESLDAFFWRGEPILLIADVGDNAGRRSSCRLYFVNERQPSRLVASAQLTYTDGAKDCEGVIAVPQDNAIYFVAKRDAQSTVYRAPLSDALAGRAITAHPIGSMPMQVSGAMSLGKLGRQIKLGQQITGLSSRSQPPSTAWLTYTHAYRRNGEDPSPGRAPTAVPYPDLPQAEAIATPEWDPEAIWIASEGEPGRLLRIRSEPILIP